MEMKRTKKILEEFLGKSFDDLNSMDAIEEKAFVEDLIGKKLKFNTEKDSRIHGRGNPLLSARRIMDIETVDRKIGESLK